jgi:PPOX class probable F420-dependent enzyme
VAVSFSEATRKLLDAKNVATVATLNPDGGPQTSVVWVLRDGDTVLFSTTKHRQKGRNLARDPRISLTVFDADEPEVYAEIRGTAELTDDPDRTLGPKVYAKYVEGGVPGSEPPEVQRIIVRVIPRKVTGSAA